MSKGWKALSGKQVYEDVRMDASVCLSYFSKF